jgi:Kef-type K+ transport system membrane component KefB
VALSLGIGIWLLPKLAHLAHRMQVTQGVLTFALVVMLIYGVAAELIGGMAAITGAFIAGLMFARSPEKQHLESGLHALGYGFFFPIFFISIGLSLNLRDLQLDALWLLIAISILGIVGKLLGSGIGAKIAGFSTLESIQLGAGMISRGEVGLIVASVGMTQGLVNDSEFSAVVGMVVVTTIVTPPLLRALFPKNKSTTRDQSTESA